ncbi:MAG: hypothetical protein GY801_38340 [bacterium]|nr:hypothetical protein [bacterium]
MFYLLGFLVVVIVVGTLLLRWTVLIMGARAGKFINETHRNIEFISNTGLAPAQWLEPFLKKAGRLQQEDPYNQRQLDRLGRAARQSCLKKLKKLIKYVYNSSLVQDEETRAILLTELTNVQQKWAEGNRDILARG